MLGAQCDEEPGGRLIDLHSVDRSCQRPREASKVGLSRKTHLEMMKAETF